MRSDGLIQLGLVIQNSFVILRLAVGETVCTVMDRIIVVLPDPLQKVESEFS